MYSYIGYYNPPCQWQCIGRNSSGSTERSVLGFFYSLHPFMPITITITVPKLLARELPHYSI